MTTTGEQLTGNPEHQRVLADPAAVDWLRRFDRATAQLPEDEAIDLRTDILDHLATTSADGPGGLADAVRRLGPPEAVAAEATTKGPWLAAPAGPAGGFAAGSITVPAGASIPVTAEPARRGLGGLEVAALLLTLLGGVVIPVLGWIAGVVLLWLSPRFTAREKVAGTLLLPGGLGAAAFGVVFAGLSASQFCSSTADAAGQQTETCSSGESWWATWSPLLLLIALVVVPVATTITIGVRAQRRARDA